MPRRQVETAGSTDHRGSGHAAADVHPATDEYAAVDVPAADVRFTTGADCYYSRPPRCFSNNVLPRGHILQGIAMSIIDEHHYCGAFGVILPCSQPMVASTGGIPFQSAGAA